MVWLYSSGTFFISFTTYFIFHLLIAMSGPFERIEMFMKRTRDSFMRLYCYHYCGGHRSRWFGLYCCQGNINRLISPKTFHEIFLAL